MRSLSSGICVTSRPSIRPPSEMSAHLLPLPGTLNWCACANWHIQSGSFVVSPVR